MVKLISQESDKNYTVKSVLRPLMLIYFKTVLHDLIILGTELVFINSNGGLRNIIKQFCKKETFSDKSLFLRKLIQTLIL